MLKRIILPATQDRSSLDHQHCPWSVCLRAILFLCAAQMGADPFPRFLSATVEKFH